MPAGVTFTENDLSFVANTRAAGFICVMGKTEKGPVRTPTTVTSLPEFERIFGGQLSNDDFAWHCRRALEGGAKLIVSRLVHYTDPADASTSAAAKAQFDVNDRQNAATSPFMNTAAGPFDMVSAIGADALIIDKDGTPAASLTLVGTQASVENGANETWDLTGGGTITVRIGPASAAVQTITFVNGDFAVPAAATAEEVAQVINAQISGGRATVTSAGARVTILDDVYGTNSRVEVTGGTLNATLLFSTTAVPGTGSAADLSAMTATEVETWINSLSDAQLTVSVNATTQVVTITNTSGTGSAVHIGLDAPSNAQANLGLPAVGAGGDQTGQDNAVEPTLRLLAKYEGTYANGYQYTISDGSNDSGTEFTLTIPVQTGILNAETYSNLSMDPSASRYAINVINQESRIAELADLNSSTTDFGLKRPATGTYTLASGNDGLTSFDENDVVGSTTAKTGIYAFDEIDGLTSQDIVVQEDIVAQGGAIGNPSTQLLLAYGDARKEVMVHIVKKMIDAADVTDNIAFRRATAPYAGGTDFDTSYGSMNTGSVKVRNPLTRKDEFVVPMGEMCAVLSYNDTGGGRLPKGTFGPWFAPAGLKRGRIRVIDVQFDLGASGNSGQLALLTDTHHVNPFIKMNGTPVFGDQFTLQKASTALQFMNVRRNLIFTELKVVEAVRSEVFEPNDPIMWRAIFRKVNPIMQDLQNQRAYYDYRVECDQNASSIDDATINNAVDIDNGIFRCRVFVKPTKAAREIRIDFTITRTDVEFQELLEAA